jgi:hypothetical protein
MIELIIEAIDNFTKSGGKTFEVNKLLENVELKTGGENFDLKGGYRCFADSINELCNTGRLVPVKNSGRNGRTPVLYAKYRISNNKNQLNEVFKNEILSLHPMLKKEYYLSKVTEYENDRDYVLSLNEYLQNSGLSKVKNCRCTLNERSFEIFNDEKFLDKRGNFFLKKLGVEMENFNCYHTYEAFFYIFLKPGEEGNALIVENKDTFMSLVRAMNLEGSAKHNANNINLLIYGEGNKITKSFEFMQELKRDNPVDKIFYYGDLDYPGIDIYQRLAKGFNDYNIVPHTKLYEQLVKSVDKPPLARNTAQVGIDVFLNYFEKNMAKKISDILNNRRYIPQEGLSFAKGEFEI